MSTEFRDPSVPVVTNVDARPASSGEAARDAVIRQVDSTVRWTDCISWMAEEGGVGTFVEVGPGKVLTGLNRRIAREARCFSIAEPSSLESWLAEA